MTKLTGKEASSLVKDEIDSLIGKLDGNLPVFYLYSDEDDMSSKAYLRGIKKKLDLYNIAYIEEFVDHNDEEGSLNVFREHSKGKMTVVAKPLHLNSVSELEFLHSIDPAYDPDMISDLNIGRLYSGDLNYLPATAAAVKCILDYYQIPVSGKKVFVLGRSLTVGLPVFELFQKYNGTVTIAHTRTSYEDIQRFAFESDIVCLATGRSGLVDRNSLIIKHTVIDCGYSPNGGDMGFVPDDGELKAYTPVPGGVGVITSYCLVRNALFLQLKNI